MPEELQAKAGAVQLRRLETFTDCVYAIAVVLVIGWLPMPEEEDIIILNIPTLQNLSFEKICNICLCFLMMCISD